MFKSTIIVDPKSEIKGKQGVNTYIVAPTIIDKKEAIRIKEVQSMIAWCTKSAFHGDNKTVIIEEMHKSSDAVPHALLKLLEEPPTDTQIVITVDRAESLLNTIRSRCAIIRAQDLTESQLTKFGLGRELDKSENTFISWLELVSKSDIERLEWLTTFAKSKKDGQALLSFWIAEVNDLINSKQSGSRPQQIKQLAALEEVSAALKQNVLPRLAFNYLHIRIRDCGV